MSDYIRKADAVKECGEWYVEEGPEEGFIGTVSQMLDMFSPADVVQVVHGKWMKEDRGHVEYCAVCDKCGFDWMWSDRGYFKFCPNCGAKMDGGDGREID